MVKRMLFLDREDAGKKLAKQLAEYVGKVSVIIFALARGGVIVGEIVAGCLHAPLQVSIVRKIGHPHQEEYAIAALSENGEIVENTEEIQKVDSAWFAQRIQEEKKVIQQRKSLYSLQRMPLDISNRVAIVVDDGVATGLSIRAAIQDVRAAHPKKIVVAAPIIPLEIAEELRREVSEVIAVSTPRTYHGAVGSYYNSFPQVTDEEVVTAVHKHKN